MSLLVFALGWHCHAQYSYSTVHSTSNSTSKKGRRGLYVISLLPPSAEISSLLLKSHPFLARIASALKMPKSRISNVVVQHYKLLPLSRKDAKGVKRYYGLEIIVVDTTCIWIARSVAPCFAPFTPSERVGCKDEGCLSVSLCLCVSVSLSGAYLHFPISLPTWVIPTFFYSVWFYSADKREDTPPTLCVVSAQEAEKNPLHLLTFFFLLSRTQLQTNWHWLTWVWVAYSTCKRTVREIVPTVQYRYLLCTPLYCHYVS